MGKVYSFPNARKKKMKLIHKFIITILCVIMFLVSLVVVLYLQSEAQAREIAMKAYEQAISNAKVQDVLTDDAVVIRGPYLQDGDAGVAIRFNVSVTEFTVNDEVITMLCTLDNDNNVFRVEIVNSEGETTLAYEREDEQEDELHIA